MKGLPVLMPGGHKRRRVKRRHSHEKGPFQPVHPRLAPFHSKLAISFQTGSIPWMKLPFFMGIPPQNPRLRGRGFGLYIRLLGVGHLRNLARSSSNNGFASRILKSGPWWPAAMPKIREIGQIGCHNVFRTSCLLVWSWLSQQWL